MALITWHGTVSFEKQSRISDTVGLLYRYVCCGKAQCEQGSICYQRYADVPVRYLVRENWNVAASWRGAEITNCVRQTDGKNNGVDGA